MQARPSDLIRRREEFGLLANIARLRQEQAGLDPTASRTAIEIGVDKAAFSVAFLQHWTGQRLYCVDPWETDMAGYDDPLNAGGRDREPDMQLAVKALAPHNDRAQILRMTSREAAPQVTEPIEFVYIDGNHHREYVLNDCQTWWPKIGHGGILAGHDFNGDWEAETHAALEAFLQKADLPPVVDYVLGDAASWYIFKPIPPEPDKEEPEK